MANTLTIDQAATVFNAVVAQAKGTSALATIDTKDFVNVATGAINTVGYDGLTTALTQVLGRTIFSARPYNRKLGFLQNDRMEYGNYSRKLQVIDSTAEDNEAYSLSDGSSIDMYKVSKPKVYQSNFYGAQTFQLRKTIYKQQLKPALRSAGEWAEFLSMIMVELQNEYEKIAEDTNRMTLVNLIAGSMSTGESTQQIHLLTEYNTEINGTLTLAQAMAPSAFPDFARWIFARIATASKAMQEYTTLYHQNPTTHATMPGVISRHTPVADQRLVLYEPFFQRVSTNVKSVSFNDGYLSTIPYEGVSFWQSASTPMGINVDASYTDTAGAVQNAAVTSSVVLGVLFDREAAGTCIRQDESMTTPYNVAGEYWNMYMKGTKEYYNDNSEPAIVLALD